MKSAATNRLVWHWYDIAGHQTTGKVEGKLWEAWARINGRVGESNVVMIAVDYQYLPDESRRTLGTFLDSFPTLTQAGMLTDIP